MANNKLDDAFRLAFLLIGQSLTCRAERGVTADELRRRLDAAQDAIQASKIYKEAR